MLFGVIGDPIAHSLSPLIHNRWMREQGLDARYVALQVAAGGLGDALRTLGDQGFRGLNITLPHKEAALAEAAAVGVVAGEIGAANTLVWRREGGWQAENTDAGGFALALEHEAVALPGLRITLLGAGGSARAIAYTLSGQGAILTVANRSLERAEKLVHALAPDAHAATLEEGLSGLPEADIVINALSLGHQGETIPLPVTRNGIFYDISYGRAAQPMLDQARRCGWRTRDGLPMLVAQAALSFEVWTGIRPDMAPALEEVRRIVGVVG